LGALFGSPVGADLTCKGGTSLSKAYRIIDRFSEDLDLTCDIRRLIADLTAGEPHSTIPVTCDIEGQVDSVSFPVASPMVISVSRTFWEKATAAHVYCAQGRIRGERDARHWHDLAAILRSPHFDTAVKDREVARAVAEHKSHFFSEKDATGHPVYYLAAVVGSLQLVPQGAAREALAAEYEYDGMLEDQVMVGDALPFQDLMAACEEVASRANAAAGP